jgi:hypothetical protein
MRKARAVGCDEHIFIVRSRLRECGLATPLCGSSSLNQQWSYHRMKRLLIASAAALGIVAAPAVATTTAKPATAQSKTQKAAAKAQKRSAQLAAKQQKAAAKTK